MIWGWDGCLCQGEGFGGGGLLDDAAHLGGVGFDMFGICRYVVIF